MGEENRRTGHKTRLERQGRILVIHLKEDLDHHNAVFIRQMADEMMEQYTIHSIVFDFSGVDFMDSSGIGVILGRHRKTALLGGCVVASEIGKNIERIFEMAGLFKTIERFETTKDAVEALKERIERGFEN